MKTQVLAGSPGTDSEARRATLSSQPSGKAAAERPFWRQALAPYARPRLGRSLFDIATSVIPYLALSALMYMALGVSYLVTLALAIPAAGFLVRTFIIFHDCTHGSFFRSKRANARLGTVLGLCTFSTFVCWRHSHAVHHATAGDLDRRGVGDIPTITVAEYQARSRRGRLTYRLSRHPLVMFGLGPIFLLVVQPRMVPRSARARIKRSVIATNLALAALVGVLCWLMTWRDYLLVQVPTIMLAGATGIWLFYVQHQFEDAYWQSGERWSYADAALQGSSYLKLPKALQFFTGNIGLHHVHHLSTRIPNYNLQRAHDENLIFHPVPTLSIADGIRALRLKLYDENDRRMLTFAQARAGSVPASPSLRLASMVGEARSLSEHTLDTPPLAEGDRHRRGRRQTATRSRWPLGVQGGSRQASSKPAVDLDGGAHAAGSAGG